MMDGTSGEPGGEDRERVLIQAVVSLARTLRDERDRLAERLREVETELCTLTTRLELRRAEMPSVHDE